MRASALERTDPEIHRAIRSEIARQADYLEMIASENFTSVAVLEALGSPLTNKYAEGYPGKRYYGGCEFVDRAEELAIERAKKIFGAAHANVQPHSGSQANMAVYFSVLKPGDPILSMNLAHGGHLTHGSPVNFSGKFFRVIPYGVRREDGRIHYDEVERLAAEHQPKMIVCGASAYPREIDFKRFRSIADGAGAYLLADIAHPAGLVAAGLFPDPVPHCHFVTSTTHKTLRGPRGGLVLAAEEVSKKVQSEIFPGIQGGPLMHVIAAKAVAFQEVLQPAFREYAAQVVANAKAFAARMIEHRFDLTSGGTDSHLVLVDLRNKNLTGKEAEAALGNAGITVNKNMVPFDDKSPFVTSGIRIGTPALTTRGMGEAEMAAIADWTAQVLGDPRDETVQTRVLKEVRELCKRFPLYAELLR